MNLSHWRHVITISSLCAFGCGKELKEPSQELFWNHRYTDMTYVGDWDQKMCDDMVTQAKCLTEEQRLELKKRNGVPICASKDFAWTNCPPPGRYP